MSQNMDMPVENNPKDYTLMEISEILQILEYKQVKLQQKEDKYQALYKKYHSILGPNNDTLMEISEILQEF